LTTFYLFVVILTIPFQESLWLDETISIWISRAGSFEEVVMNALYFQGQSPLYFVFLSFLQKLTGDFALLRVVSVVMLLMSGAILYGIVRRTTENPSAAAVALGCYFTIDRIIANGVSLRPYSMALLFGFLSVYCLIREREEGGGLRWRAAHILSFVLAMYSHYFFGALTLVHGFFAAFWVRKAEQSRVVGFVTNQLIAYLCLLPAVPHLRALAARTTELTIASPPTFSLIGSALFPVATTVSLVMAVLLGCVCFAPRISWDPGGVGKSFSLALFWWLAVPLLLAVSAGVGIVNFFLDRYHLWTAGGFCFVVGIALGAFKPAKMLRVVIVLFFLIASFRTVGRQWQTEDWARVVEIIRQEAREGEAPVLAYTGLIEAEKSEWLEKHPRYLTAPLQVYAVAQPVLPLPSRFHSEGAREYLHNQILPMLGEVEEVFVLSARKHLLKENGELEELSTGLLEALAERANLKRETLFESTTLVLERMSRPLK
jgi:hypothetical protein